MLVNTHNVTIFGSSNESKKFLKNKFFDGDINKIAALWTLGVEIDWSIFTKEIPV